MNQGNRVMKGCAKKVEFHSDNGCVTTFVTDEDLTMMAALGDSFLVLYFYPAGGEPSAITYGREIASRVSISWDSRGFEVKGLDDL